MGRLIEFPIIDHANIPVCEGGCPKCGKVDAILNIERDHYCVCHAHKNKWYRGENLFAFWRYEDEQIWAQNAILLGTYRDVEPLLPTRDEAI